MRCVCVCVRALDHNGWHNRGINKRAGKRLSTIGGWAMGGGSERRARVGVGCAAAMALWVGGCGAAVVGCVAVVVVGAGWVGWGMNRRGV